MSTQQTTEVSPISPAIFFPSSSLLSRKKKQHRCLHGTALLPTVCYIRFNTQVVDVFSSNKCCSRKDETFLYLLYIYYVCVITFEMYIWTMNICWNHHLVKLTCSCDHIYMQLPTLQGDISTWGDWVGCRHGSHPFRRLAGQTTKR